MMKAAHRKFNVASTFKGRYTLVKKSITFIELIIVLCFIVVSVRLWTQHKDPEAKTVQHTSRPTVTIPTPMLTTETSAFEKVDNEYTICPKCGSNSVRLSEYVVHVKTGLRVIAAKECKKCRWHILTCPQCGSHEFIEIPGQPSDVMPGGYTLPRTNCKKCGWGS